MSNLEEKNINRVLNSMMGEIKAIKKYLKSKNNNATVSSSELGNPQVANNSELGNPQVTNNSGWGNQQVANNSGWGNPQVANNSGWGNVQETNTSGFGYVRETNNNRENKPMTNKDINSLYAKAYAQANNNINNENNENNSSTKGKIKMMKEANSKGNIPRKKEIAKTIGEKLNENPVKGSEVMWYSNKDNRFKKGVLGNPNEYRAGVGKKYKINNAKEINGTTIFSPQSPVSVNTLRKYNNNIRNIM